MYFCMYVCMYVFMYIIKIDICSIYIYSVSIAIVVTFIDIDIHLYIMFNITYCSFNMMLKTNNYGLLTLHMNG